MTVRDIGAMLDSHLAMDSHINSVIRSCYVQIRSLSHIRKYLTFDTAKTLAHAFITSRLDNMNSLLYDIPDYQIRRLQSVQHHVARIISLERKSSDIKPTLIKLHWLPIEYRIKFKILLLVYKSLHGEGPSYLASMLEEYQPPRPLRSSAQLLLSVPFTHKKYGDRAFSVAGPRLWNALPISLKTAPSVNAFKKSLKTHLFKIAYNV